jgi:uncharacterized protein related to proFAR isomerase
MHLLPVIDLKRGRAVHACAGRRDQYRPLRSVWTDRADDPFVLAAELRRRLGCGAFYVADLDAIEGSAEPIPPLSPPRIRGGREWWSGRGSGISSRLAEEYALWLDAGFDSAASLDGWASLGRCPNSKVIVAGETIGSWAALASIVDAVEVSRVVFSLDLFAGKVRSRLFHQMGGRGEAREDPEAIVERVVEHGLRQLIVLDIACVGTRAGPGTLAICRRLRRRFPFLTLATGGGIRDGRDLQQAADAGVDVALVATALHQGAFSERDLVRFQFVSAGREA